MGAKQLQRKYMTGCCSAYLSLVLLNVIIQQPQQAVILAILHHTQSSTTHCHAYNNHDHMLAFIQDTRTV